MTSKSPGETPNPRQSPKPITDVITGAHPVRDTPDADSARVEGRAPQTSDPGMAHNAARPSDPAAVAGRENQVVEGRAANEAPRESPGLPQARGLATDDEHAAEASRLGVNAVLDDLNNTVVVLAQFLPELVEAFDTLARDLEAHPGPGGAEQAYGVKNLVRRLREVQERAFKVAAPTSARA